MDDSQIDGLSVFANGVFPVEISAGKRINAAHRVAVRASVDVASGEVRFFVDPQALAVLRSDTDAQ